MSNEVSIRLDPAAIEQVLLGGDLSRMNSAQKISYYNKVCELVGLNPLTKPFDYLRLNQKEVLYANKGCAEQLRSVHKIGLKIVDKQKIDDVYVVTAEALNPDGRTDSATGAVTISGLKGESLANAMMKAETKAKRRVTLSICGLNMLDDTEVDTIPDAKKLGNDPGRISPDQPAPDEGNPNAVHGYTIPFGKFARKSLEEIPPDELESYAMWLESNAEKKGQPLGAVHMDFIERVKDHMIAMHAPKDDGYRGDIE